MKNQENLSQLSNQELRKLLIQHLGISSPVTGSTRRFLQHKLEESFENPQKPSITVMEDKTKTKPMPISAKELQFENSSNTPVANSNANKINVSKNIDVPFTNTDDFFQNNVPAPAAAYPDEDKSIDVADISTTRLRPDPVLFSNAINTTFSPLARRNLGSNHPIPTPTLYYGDQHEQRYDFVQKQNYKKEPKGTNFVKKSTGSFCDFRTLFQIIVVLVLSVALYFGMQYFKAGDIKNFGNRILYPK